MTAKRYSDFPVVANLDGTEIVPVMSAGVTKQTTSAQILSATGGLYSVYIPPSGDVTGATDTAAFIAADVLAGQGARTIAGISDPLGYAHNLLASGTYYINQSNAFMNPVNRVAKVRGRVLEGRGSNLTQIVYTGTGPFATNQTYQNVQMFGLSVLGNSTAQDFLWNQEQAGVSNIQHNRFEDLELNGLWGNGFRHTGGNNNSECGWHRCTSGPINNYLYVPPPLTASITSGQVNISIGNNPQIFYVGDTVFFGTTVGSITANTQYYIVAATTTTMQISTSRGGAALTPNATNASVTSGVGTDQFLNYWFNHFQFDPSTSQGSIINMSYGGSIAITDCDVSGWLPTVDSYLFNLLNSPSAQGVCSFKVSKLRIEHKSDHALLLNSKWPQGNVTLDQVDQSSQVSNRTPTIQYINFDITNNAGPNVEISNSQLIGTMGVTTGSNNFRFQNKILVRNCQLLQNEPAAYVNWTNAGNSGGAPRVRFIDCITRSNSNTVGYQGLMETDLFWNKSIGGLTTEKIANICGANSDAPISSGSTPAVRIALNGAITKIWFWKAAGGAGGAFQFTLQTTEAVPTVLAGGAATPMAGSNSSLAIPLYEVKLTTPFVMTTDLARSIVLVDTLGRAGSFTGFYCLVFYIG